MLAKRYAKLPSEIVEKATTLDLAIFDMAVSYETYKDKLSKGSVQPDEDEVIAAFLKAREQDNESQS